MRAVSRKSEHCRRDDLVRLTPLYWQSSGYEEIWSVSGEMRRDSIIC